MKSACKGSVLRPQGSLPVWGEGIEIVFPLIISHNVLSLPVWGEGIEIGGVGGLGSGETVSPRMGRGD